MPGTRVCIMLHYSFRELKSTQTFTHSFYNIKSFEGDFTKIVNGIVNRVDHIQWQVVFSRPRAFSLFKNRKWSKQYNRLEQVKSTNSEWESYSSFTPHERTMPCLLFFTSLHFFKILWRFLLSLIVYESNRKSVLLCRAQLHKGCMTLFHG